VHVTVTDSGFSPANLTIAAGTTVIWTNRGSVAHTVTDGGKFNSGNLPVGATFKYTFTIAGTYHYVCSYHPFMVGKIGVH
jgi:plastocyanin